MTGAEDGVCLWWRSVNSCSDQRLSTRVVVQQQAALPDRDRCSGHPGRNHGTLAAAQRGRSGHPRPDRSARLVDSPRRRDRMPARPRRGTRSSRARSRTGRRAVGHPPHRRDGCGVPRPQPLGLGDHRVVPHQIERFARPHPADRRATGSPPTHPRALTPTPTLGCPCCSPWDSPPPPWGSARGFRQ